MEIKIPHQLMRETLRGWANEITQRGVAERITREYLRLGLNAPRLAVIEYADGTVDFDAWHNNKQQLFRWLDSESPAAQLKIQQLMPAILGAMPTELRARTIAGNSIEYLATKALREHQQAISAALLHASPADFERDCEEAERAFSEFRQAVTAQIH